MLPNPLKGISCSQCSSNVHWAYFSLHPTAVARDLNVWISWSSQALIHLLFFPFTDEHTLKTRFKFRQIGYCTHTFHRCSMLLPAEWLGKTGRAWSEMYVWGKKQESDVANEVFLSPNRRILQGPWSIVKGEVCPTSLETYHCAGWDIIEDKRVTLLLRNFSKVF